MFIAALFAIVKMWKQPNCPSTGEEINKVCLHIQLFSPKKEWSADTRYNLDETWKPYSKWKKPGTKCHVLYDFFYMEYLE